MPKIFVENGQYFLDQEDGSEAIECKVWLETSKKSEAHPEGKPHIVLPNGNITNRKYVSLDSFNASAVDGVMDIAIKTSGPRVLGATGVKESVVKYLSDEDAAEYRTLVEGAVAKYKEAKGNSRKKRLEDMNEAELEAALAALKSGTTIKVGTTGPHSFIDVMTEDEYARYNELLAKSVENKANMPKAARGPLTPEQKAARAEKRKAANISKIEGMLAALKAKRDGGNDDFNPADFIEE